MNFFPDEFKVTNDEHKEALISFLRSGEAFLMAGAGVSAMCKLPTWDELIEQLEAAAMERDDKFERRKPKEKVLEYTERILVLIGDRFYDIISDIFGTQPEITEAQLALVRLPFKAILTTNYDRVLFTAIMNAHKANGLQVVIDKSFNQRETYKFFKAINDDGKGPKRVVYLHGHCDFKNSIVLSASQYSDKYGIQLLPPEEGQDDGGIKDMGWPFLRKIMWSLMATRRLLYVGFSMNDEYFRIMHAIVSDDARHGGTDMHFLLQRVVKGDNLDEKIARAKSFKEHYGIQTVFFEDDDSYSGLPNLIFELEDLLVEKTNGEEPVVTDKKEVAQTEKMKPAGVEIIAVEDQEQQFQTLKEAISNADAHVAKQRQEDLAYLLEFSKRLRKDNVSNQ